jgi:DNA primase
LLAGWLGVEVEIVTAAVAQGARKINATQTEPEVEGVDQSWRPHPQEPRLLLEREVLKARLQMPDLVTAWSEIEASAFTHPAYVEMKRVIDSHSSSTIQIDEIADERMKTLFTELSVEPIRSDGEVSARYIESIVARLREVGISRAIADLKSNLQRLNPVENAEEYNAAFASLVALETTRRGLHELAMGSL